MIPLTAMLEREPLAPAHIWAQLRRLDLLPGIRSIGDYERGVAIGFWRPMNFSRSELFDYRHSMRELHRIFETVRTSTALAPVELGQMVCEALRDIEKMRTTEFLLV